MEFASKKPGSPRRKLFTSAIPAVTEPKTPPLSPSAKAKKRAKLGSSPRVKFVCHGKRLASASSPLKQNLHKKLKKTDQNALQATVLLLFEYSRGCHTSVKNATEAIFKTSGKKYPKVDVKEAVEKLFPGVVQGSMPTGDQKNGKDSRSTIQVYKNLKIKLAADSQDHQQQPNPVTESIPLHLKRALQKELKYLQTVTNINVKNIDEDDDLELAFNEHFFETTSRQVEEKCPILKDIIQVLATGPRDERNTGKKTQAYKFKTALQLVLALDGIKSQHSTSDFSTVFGLLLLSHGAGKTLLDVLQTFGLCKGYEFYRKFLNKRLESYKAIIDKKFPLHWPVIIMFDNINIHKGRSRHVRLKQSVVPIMWNFTVRAALKPDCCGIESLWKEPKTATEPQKSLSALTVDDLFIGSDVNLQENFNKEMDSMFLEAINMTASGPELLESMSQEDFHDVITGQSSTTKTNGIPGLAPGKMSSNEGVSAKNVMILPFSLADEAYTCGEAVIYREYSKEFHLGIERKDSYIPFNKVKKIYDLKASRERYKVYRELDVHEHNLEQMKDLFNSERQFIDTLVEGLEPVSDLTASNFKSQMKLKATAILQAVEELQASVENLSFSESLQYLKSNLGKWISIRDDFDRTILHLTVEKGLIKLTECLLASGAEVNATEGSGATPLLVAVLTKQCNTGNQEKFPTWA